MRTCWMGPGVLVLALLAGCQPAIRTTPAKPAGPGTPAVPAVPAAPAATVKVLSWEGGHPERGAWSDELRSAIRPALANLELAQDIEKFAPNYKGLPESRRIDVWAALFVAIAYYESGYDPRSIFKETSGQDSVGLLQLSYEDQKPYGLEPLDRKARSLEDPLVNLRCGVKIMAHLVARDRVIAGGSSLKDGRGGGRYWSTLWEGHHLAGIQEMVKKQALTR